MKKAFGMQFIVWILVAMISFIVLFSIANRLFSQLDDSSKTQICRAEIMFANKLLDHERVYWAFDKVENEAAEQALKHPWCETQVKEIDLSKYNGETLSVQAGIEIGEMIENCWKTFGEGQYINTFGQGQSKFIFFTDTKNYYFSCFKFKFKFDESEDLSILDLLETSGSSSGVLWDYNLNGKKIGKSVSESFEEFENGDENMLSYAGYVFFNNGYLEFVSDVDEKVVFDLSEGQAVAPWWDRSSFLMFALTKKIVPSKAPLDKIYSDQWYELRYYSPFIAEPEKYSEDFVLNNIKIVSLASESKAEEIKGVLG